MRANRRAPEVESHLMTFQVLHRCIAFWASCLVNVLDSFVGLGVEQYNPFIVIMRRSRGNVLCVFMTMGAHYVVVKYETALLSEHSG